MDKSIISWLLELENPSVRYRTMVEMLEYDPLSPDVLETKNMIPESKAVTDIIKKMHPDGYWLDTQNLRTKKVLGDGVQYANYTTTHYCLSYLSELGLTRDHSVVAKASERYLNLQGDDGDWYGHFSCLYGYNIRTFIRFGYMDDPRIQRSIKLMLDTVRGDGGYLCDHHEGKYKTKMVKSCIRGSAKTLLAFSELPEYYEHPRCKELVNYFLQRDGIYSIDKKRFVNNDMKELSFPILWRSNTWEILYALSKMGYGREKSLDKAWNILEAKADSTGLYKLEWTPPKVAWKVGKRNELNKWVTFYVLLAKKYRDSKITCCKSA